MGLPPNDRGDLTIFAPSGSYSGNEIDALFDKLPQSNPVQAKVTDMEHEAALRILREWVQRWHDEPGFPRAEAVVRALALEVGVDAQFDAAIGYAIDQGWLDNTTPGWIRITQAGVRAGQQP